MTRPTLNEIIEGRLTSTDAQIVPTDDEPVRAVDVLGHLAAVYRFSVDVSGAWFAACTLACRTQDGQWQDSGSGGSHGEGWDVPWQPSSRTLDGHAISIFGSVGPNLLGNEDRIDLVRAIYGFTDPMVRALRVSAASGERILTVNSPAKAFVVVVVGESAVRTAGNRPHRNRRRTAGNHATHLRAARAKPLPPTPRYPMGRDRQDGPRRRGSRQCRRSS